LRPLSTFRKDKNKKEELEKLGTKFSKEFIIMKKYNDPISKSLYALTKKYEMNIMFDMYAMYIDIQNRYELLKQQYPDVHIKEFDLPTDDGNYFHFEFPEKQNVQMWAYNTENGEKILITKDYKTTKELQDAMDTRTEDMRLHSVHLGEAPTDNFLNSLNDVQIGDIVTYNTGFTLIVKDRNGLKIDFLTAYQNIENITMKNFSSQDVQTVNISRPANMRELYRLAKDLRTETCELRSTTQKSVRSELETEVLSLNMFETKKFYVGDEWFISQKTPIGIKWFDKDRNKINEDTVVRFYAWQKLLQHIFQFVYLKTIFLY
jgi:hypothetical protein